MNAHRILIGTLVAGMMAAMALSAVAAGELNIVLEVQKLLKAEVADEVILSYVAAKGGAELS